MGNGHSWRSNAQQSSVKAALRKSPQPQGHDPAMSKAAIYQDAPQTKVRNVSNFVQPDSQAAAKIADRWSRWPLPPIVKVVTRSFRNGMNEASDLANWPDRPHMRSSSTDNATHGAGKEETKCSRLP
jgi:hypothetical protein